MEKGFESYDLNSSSLFGLQPRIAVPASGNMQNSPTFAAHEPRKAGVPEEPRGWFYGLPRYRQCFVNSNPPKQQFTDENPNGNIGGQKKFLVFDQSGDRTTLVYSSGAAKAAPIHYHLPSWQPLKPRLAFDFETANAFTGKDGQRQTRCLSEEDVRSEMREDTEELNALLYSDEEIDKETSTGHSPSGFETRKRVGEEEEEVASSGGPGKKRKLEDTVSSAESGVYSSSDAETGRKAKVNETITLLRSLIPGGKNKNAMIVIDEAIEYLKSLKDKAKDLGLES